MSEKSCALAAIELVLATRDARLSLREFKSLKNQVVTVSRPDVTELDKARITLDQKIVHVQAILNELQKCGLDVAKPLNRGQRARTTIETVVKNIKIGGVAKDSMAAPWTGREITGFLNRIPRDIVKQTMPVTPPAEN